MSYIQTNSSVIIPDTAAYTISSADSGKIILLTQQNQACAVTLPALAVGLCFKIIVKDATAGAGAGDNTTFAPAAGAVVGGTLLNTGGAALINKTGASANFQILTASVIGDYVDLYCDGTHWLVAGVSSVVGFA